jgi:hypothetical protein
MEGMLAPEMKEEVLGTAEIRDIQNLKLVQLQVVWLWMVKLPEMLKSGTVLFMKVNL